MYYKKFTFSAVLVMFGLHLMAQPYVWQEKPSEGNFNTVIDWPILTGKNAVALMPDQPVPANPFVEFSFQVKTSGEYYIWGRTFDPAWSSPGKWRIDSGSWRAWKPEASVYREVWNGSLPLDWCCWGKVILATGEHKLRLELTGKRPAGDFYYFIFDALLLTQDGEYRPEGHMCPADEINAVVNTVKAEAAKISDPKQRDEIARQTKAIAANAADDYDGIFELKKIARDLIPKRNNDNAEIVADDMLHGRVETVNCKDGKVSWQLVLNRPWAGKYWVGFLQDNALYAVYCGESKNESRTVRGEMPLPAGLPGGRVVVRFVPLDTPSIFFVCGNIYLKKSAKEKVIKPSAWGVYRDSAMVQHPWYVNENNTMVWDGKPYIPFGGMMNTRVTWASKSGDGDVNDSMERGFVLMEKQYQLLRKYGITDIYYNGCFPVANPNYLRRLVALTEKYDMQYGLEVTTIPAIYGKGFVKYPDNVIEVKSGVSSVTIKTTTTYPHKEKIEYNENFRYDPPHRCIWTLVDGKGRYVEGGIGTLSKSGMVDKLPELSMTVKFNRSAPKGAKLFFVPEIAIVHSNDPVAYIDSVEESFAKMKEFYGKLKLGRNFRFFIDPLQNEMTSAPIAVSTGKRFRDGFESFLYDQYRNVGKLNRAWQMETAIPDLTVAARLFPMHDNDDNGKWIDPDNGTIYSCRQPGSQALRDLRVYRGQVCQQIINRSADVLKTIADVPVVLKHNLWFSDWFVNPNKRGGLDGVGMESYCYGDSLAYHNSVVVYAEAMQGARNQWCLVTESSAAAFEGQKNYCGYLDRYQMMDDIDQLSMLGAKGFFHFGFSFAENEVFFTTELTRDPRQLEWLATLGKIYKNSAALPGYRPQLYGWYPAGLKEREIVGDPARSFEMDGNYTGVPTQIRMAPDGNWMVPALNQYAAWKGLFVAEPLLSVYQLDSFNLNVPDVPLFRLSNSGSNALNSFTANGIGLIPVGKNIDRLRRFQEDILGYVPFQTEDINGYRSPDGSMMVWTCVEKLQAALKLPATAEAFTLSGKRIAINNNRLVLKREENKQLRDNLPSHLDNGYYYIDNGQPEVAVIKNAKMEDILRINRPAFYRWLPNGTDPDRPLVWIEAEDFVATTFTQPSLVGYSRYSNRAIGINTHHAPPSGKHYESDYRFKVASGMPDAKLYLRRMDVPSMNLEILIDGKSVGTIKADSQLSDLMHLTPWNSGLAKDNVNVGWARLKIGRLSPGEHRLTIVAQGGSEKFAAGTKLMGAAEKDVNAESLGQGLRAVQIDAIMITEQ